MEQARTASRTVENLGAGPERRLQDVQPHPKTQPETDSSDTVDRRPRRRWMWAVVIVAMAGTAIGGWVVGRRIQSPEQAASRAAPPAPSWITANVERRVLSKTVILRGDVRPQTSIEIAAPTSIEGSVIVTAPAAAIGQDVIEGMRIIEVSGRPVFVLLGAVPVYRTLKPGMRGVDVSQLQAALARLGFAPDVDGVFGEATKTAVATFYNAAGYDPKPVSDTAAAAIAAAEQAITDAQNAVDVAEAELAALTASGPTAGVVAATAELDAANRAVQDVAASTATANSLAQQALDVAVAAYDRLLANPESAQADLDQAAFAASTAQAELAESKRSGVSANAAAKDRVAIATAALADAQPSIDATAATLVRDNAVTVRDQAAATLMAVVAANGPTVAQGEIVFVPTLPARVQASVDDLGPTAVGGDGSSPAGGPSGTLVTLSTGDLVVEVTARDDVQELISVGTAVELLDEQSNETFPAVVSAVGDAPSSGTDGVTGFPVTITADPNPLPENLTGANLRVTIEVATTDTEALVVPLAAVSAAADGTTRVSLLRGDATEPHDVPVAAGLSADGFVVIIPQAVGSVVSGDRVIVGR